MNGNPENFWKNVHKDGPIPTHVPQLGKCWMWAGYVDVGRGNYGAISYAGKKISTHRLSYLFANGSIPIGKCVLHKCDNRLCVNPEHLFLGTRRDNVFDMVEKNRHTRKMSVTDVIKIRSIHKEMNLPVKVIAEQFQLSRMALYRILKHRSWKHVI